jgi:hypothetical protein
MIKFQEDSSIQLNLGVVGSRTFSDRDLIFAWLDRLHKELGPFDRIIAGDSIGPDMIAQKWGKNNQLDVKVCYADWTNKGKEASYLRNINVIDGSDLIVAFWDGDSKGTAHAIRITRMANKPLLVISKSGTNYELLSTIKFQD